MLGTGVQAQAVQGPLTDEPVGGAPLRPVISLGLSRLFGDIDNEGLTSFGPTARAGVRVAGLEIALAAWLWPELDDYRYTSLQLEIAQDLADAGVVTPRLVFSTGYTWFDYHGSARLAEDPDGLSAAFGLGLDVAPWESVHVGLNLAIRTDGGGYTIESNVLARYLDGRRVVGSTDRGAGPFVLWIQPIAGPWRLVSPGYGLRVGQDLPEGLTGNLTVGIVHWQIPGPEPGTYGWDTRAFVAAPGLGWRPWDQLPWVLRGGPLVVGMGEGPDSGISLGMIGEVGAAIDLGVEVNAGVGLMWYARESTEYPGDQVGLTLRAGVQF